MAKIIDNFLAFFLDLSKDGCFKASDKRVDFLSKLNEHKMGCVVYNDHMNMKDTAKRRDWSACYRSFVNQICPPLRYYVKLEEI